MRPEDAEICALQKVTRCSDRLERSEQMNGDRQAINVGCECCGTSATCCLRQAPLPSRTVVVPIARLGMAEIALHKISRYVDVTPIALL
jgi:hypothetical protein